MSIQRRELPDTSLLQTYRAAGAYTDCFATEVPGTISHERFVRAFYTTWLFKLERWILKWSVRKPSTDEEAAQLADGTREAFAAWTVERRTDDQVLLCDFMQRTRSWLMVERIGTEHEPRTRLYFGSAIVPVTDPKTGARRLGFAFQSLLGFHTLYSVLLLRTARARVSREQR